MGYVTGDDRRQPCLLPPVIDDYVDPNAPVRVIDVFVDGLDFSALGFERAAPASTGRPGYDPRDLLKLYIYGYLNEVRSSRRLERECKRNVEVMWLVGRLAPDHKTIADFRRDNGAAIVGACRAFVLFCRDQGLFTAVLVSIDGSKVRAAASTLRVLDQSRIAEEAQKIDAEVARYLAELDQADAVDHGDACEATTQALAALRERRAELNRLATHLDKGDRRLVVDGELDARPMGYRRGGKPPSYNVQIAVDADTGIVVHHDVTDEVNDLRMLHPMAVATRDLLGRDTLKVVAHTGYSNGNAAAACEADGIVACVPAIRSVNNRGDGDQFDRSRFRYEPEHDQYTCPAGRTMHRKGPVNRNSLYYVSRDCSGCTLKPHCTQAEFRWVSRHQHEDALERMTKRVADEPALMRRRRCSAEHPFGKGWSNTVSVAAYGSFTQSAFYLDALAGYAYSNNQMQRQISISNLQPRTANGSTGANQFLAQVEAGYGIPVYAPAAATVTPFARFQTSSINQAAFSEWGANSLSLNVAQQTTTSVRTTLGADLAGAIGLGDTRTLDLRLRLGWLHEYADTARPITAAFAGAPSASFTVYGATPQRDAAVIGFQASTHVAAATQLYLRYDGEIASGADNHTLNVGLRLSW